LGRHLLAPNNAKGQQEGSVTALRQWRLVIREKYRLMVHAVLEPTGFYTLAAPVVLSNSTPATIDPRMPQLRVCCFAPAASAQLHSEPQSKPLILNFRAGFQREIKEFEKPIGQPVTVPALTRPLHGGGNPPAKRSAEGYQMSDITMGRYQEKTLRAAEWDQQRGYSINYKQVGLAFAIEIIIVITSLIGAWLMANKYGRTSTDHLLMMLAPVAYAMVECSRVPLAPGGANSARLPYEICCGIRRPVCGGRNDQVDVYVGRNHVPTAP
jgi:hypothetical protein